MTCYTDCGCSQKVELKMRISELEAEEQLFNKTFDAQQAEIEELRAENQRMRAAARAVADARDALGRGDCRVNEYSELVLSDMRAHEKLAALLGGRE